jgi:hypothetical protein
MTDIYGGNTDAIFTEGVRTSEIEDTDQTNNNVKIDLSSADTINLIAPNVLVNGAPIGGGGGGVQNPLTSNLDIGAFDVEGVGLSLLAINSSVGIQQLKTQNIASVAIGTTNFTGTLEATTHKTIGGLNTQYTMGDGSLLTYSSNSGNSNFYLFNNNTNLSPTPANGNISFNSDNQFNATYVYISHRTRDNIDIDIYFNQLSQSSEVYLQDQTDSTNFIQYNIIGSPVITPNAYVAIPVQARTASGTGFAFPNGHNLIVSFFTNGIEVDARLTTLETKTQYQTATALTTSLASSITMSDGILTTPMTLTSQTKNFLTPNSWTLGFKFTTSVPITINKIGTDISQWVIGSTRILRIYAEGNTTSIYDYAITRTTIYGLYYVTDTNITLPAGTYRLGIDSPVNTWYNTTPLVFDSRITGVVSALATTSGVYPSTLGSFPNVAYQGMFWIKDSVPSALTINGGINLNGIANMDVENWSRPFIGLQFIHNSISLTTLSNSLWTVVGNALVVSPFAITNNASRQLCCVLTTPSGAADGTTTGIVSTSLTGSRVMTQYPFGLVAAFNINDTGTFQANNCQNFIGLWNVATSIVLNQTTQLSVQRNMICFGSNTTDTNLCIYTGGASSTRKQVDLGAYFPANRPSATVSADWFKLSLYWDGTNVYFRAINTLYPSISAANITGFFTPLATDMPNSTTAMYPQILRIMGTPNVVTQGKLQIQRFGIIL